MGTYAGDRLLNIELISASDFLRRGDLVEYQKVKERVIQELRRDGTKETLTDDGKKLLKTMKLM